MYKQANKLVEFKTRVNEKVNINNLCKPEILKLFVFVTNLQQLSTHLLDVDKIQLQTIYFCKNVLPFFQTLMCKNNSLLFKSMVSFAFFKKSKGVKSRSVFKAVTKIRSVYIRGLQSDLAILFWKKKLTQVKFKAMQHSCVNPTNGALKMLQRYLKQLAALRAINRDCYKITLNKSTSFFLKKKNLTGSKLLSIRPVLKHKKKKKKHLRKLTMLLGINYTHFRDIQKFKATSTSDRRKLAWLGKAKRKTTKKNWLNLYGAAKLAQSKLRKQAAEVLKVQKNKYKHKKNRYLKKPKKPITVYLRKKLKNLFKNKLNKRRSKSNAQLLVVLILWSGFNQKRLTPYKDTKKRKSRQHSTPYTSCSNQAPVESLHVGYLDSQVTSGNNPNLVNPVHCRNYNSVKSTQVNRKSNTLNFCILKRQQKNITLRKRTLLRKHSTYISTKRIGWLSAKKAANRVDSKKNYSNKKEFSETTPHRLSTSTKTNIQSLCNKRQILIRKKLRKFLKKRRPAFFKQKIKKIWKAARRVKHFVIKKQKKLRLRRVRKTFSFFFSKYKNWRRKWVRFFNRKAKKFSKKRWIDLSTLAYKAGKKPSIINNKNPKRAKLRLLQKSTGAAFLHVKLYQTVKLKPKIKNFIKFFLNNVQFACTSGVREKDFILSNRKGKHNLGKVRQRQAVLVSTKTLLTTSLAVCKNTLHNVYGERVGAGATGQNLKAGLNLYGFTRSGCEEEPNIVTTNWGRKLLTLKQSLRLKKSFVASILNARVGPATGVRRLRRLSKKKRIIPFICKKMRKKPGATALVTSDGGEFSANPVFVFSKQRIRKKNVINQRKSNKVLRLKRYNHLNILASLQQFAVNKYKEFEEFKEWRIHRRCWPQEPSHKSKRAVFLKKKKDNYLVRLKTMYTSFFIKTNNNQIKTPQLSMLCSSTARLLIAKNRPLKKGRRNNTSAALDLSRKFIEVLWKAQLYHRYKYQKQILSNRWKFKKKFWIWYRYVSKFKSLQYRHGMSELPSLFLYLVKIGLFSSLTNLRRVSRYNTLMLNSQPVTSERVTLSIGDIIQVSPNIKTALSFSLRRKSVLYKRMKKYKKIQRIVIQSQWRDRKKMAPNNYTDSTYFQFFAVPVWTQFDFFTSSIAVIRQPHKVQSVHSFTSSRYMLDKLTPWRLKI